MSETKWTSDLDSLIERSRSLVAFKAREFGKADVLDVLIGELTNAIVSLRSVLSKKEEEIELDKALLAAALAVTAALKDELIASRTETARLREALEKAAPKLAVLEFLIEGASYSYGGDSASEPTPPEFGISWAWQASTPERPSMWEQLVRDATKHFIRVVSEIDDEVEPSAFEKECVAHLSALSAATALSLERGESTT